MRVYEEALLGWYEKGITCEQGRVAACINQQAAKIHKTLTHTFDVMGRQRPLESRRQLAT